MEEEGGGEREREGERESLERALVVIPNKQPVHCLFVFVWFFFCLFFPNCLFCCLDLPPLDLGLLCS